MKRSILTAIVLAALCLATLVLTVAVARTQLADGDTSKVPRQSAPGQATTPDIDSVLSTVCAVQPEKSKKPGARTALTYPASRSTTLVTLERFRRLQVAQPVVDQSTAKQLPTLEATYQPREEIALVDPTNYGDRYLRDINGNPAIFDPIIVLHETVGSASSTINYFQTPHPKDEDQVSYHALIRLDGTVVYMVPPDKRAFGAGNSMFVGANGRETVRTHPVFPGSVNNFAYHVSLETPYDGNNNAGSHSGYTQAQYQSLAWLVAKTGVSNERITTHQAVDRSQSRMDPRSFSYPQFLALLDSLPRTADITIPCTIPPDLAAPQ